MRKSLICLFFICLLATNTNAATIKFVDDKYSTTVGWKIKRIYVDNELSYCLEPGVEVGTNGYQKQNVVDYSKISAAQKRDINRIGLFGNYLYAQAKNNGGTTYYRYYYAAQELIWDKLVSQKHRFKTDLSTYRSKINSLVKDFDKKLTS